MKSIKTIYLAGSITNNPLYKIEFEHAEAQVKDIFPDAEIFNPVTLCEKKGISDWDGCMAHTHLFLEKADTVALVRGWTVSKGARLELSYALTNDMNVIELEANEYKQKITAARIILNDVLKNIV